MKYLFLLLTVICCTQFSCSKTNLAVSIPSSLNGKWQMIKVEDVASGSTTTRPASIQKDVEIVFAFTSPTAGTFTGNTPTNDIWKSEVSIGSNQTIHIPYLSMTKVAETPWGILFVSSFCSSFEYSFEYGGLLNIKTTDKILTFRKG